MAYNLFKGTVEGSVDQHGDQEISGIKVFKSTISASVFYDTDAQSPCATIKEVALKEITPKASDSLIVYGQADAAYTHHTLKFDKKNQTLLAKNITAQLFEGSAEGLRNIKAQSVIGKLDADNVNYGPGLQNIRGALQVKSSSGISASDDGLSINLAVNGGLSLESDKLSVDPRRTEAINRDGQNLSDHDLLLVADISRGTIENTTLLNLYDRYIKTKTLKAAGNLNEIQIKARTGLTTSPNLLYDTDKDLLMVDGSVSAKTVKINGSLDVEGQVKKNIVKIQSETYQVQKNDYTILCDSLKNKITVVLPPACNSKGRIIVVKKANSQKHKINSNIVNIKVEEGTIDLKDTLSLKMNYSARTLQSDGENWCIIGSVGT
tara:strand:- start:526 stop:1659 length:1134 start_codon:yes stop_codon:yes gene_type:complete